MGREKTKIINKHNRFLAIFLYELEAEIIHVDDFEGYLPKLLRIVRGRRDGRSHAFEKS